MAVTTDKIQLDVQIGGEKAGSTLKELTSISKVLNKEIQNLKPGTAEFIKKAEEIQKVEAQLKEARNAIKGINTEMAKTGSGFKNFASGAGDSLMSLVPIGAAAMGAFAADKLITGLQGAVSAFNEAENAAFQMHNSLVTLGGESEETFQRLMDQADMLEQTTFGFSAEQIQGAQQQLKTFGLTGAEIEKLTPKLLDYATVTKKDLAGAVDDVTSAMSKKDKALQKAGIRLDETKLTVQGVTDSLDKFGGSATAALDKGTNRTEVFADKWGKVEEVVGGFVANVGLKLLEWIEPVATKMGELGNQLVALYDSFMLIVTPISLWVDKMAETYPWLGKIKDALVGWLNPFSAIKVAITSVVTVFGYLVAGVVATVKTVNEQWGNMGKFITDNALALGAVITTFLTNPFNVGPAIANAKSIWAKGGGDLANAFTDNFDKAMESFKGVPAPADTAPIGNIKDRSIVDPDKAKADAEKSAKAAADAKAKADKQAQDEYKKVIEEEKKLDEEAQKRREKELEERMKFRLAYNQRLLEANKLIQEQDLAGMEEGLDKELRLLDIKKGEELAKIEAYEAEAIANEAISEEERTKILNTYAQQRANIDASYRAQKEVKEEEHNQRLLDIANRNSLAQNDLELLAAGDNGQRILDAKIARLILEKNIELQNKELTEAEKLAIEKKYEAERDALYRAEADKKKALDKEVQNAGIQILQSSISALTEFSKMATDKQVGEAEKLKASRIKKLDQEKAAGRITEEKYAKQKEAIEAQGQEKIAAIKRKQAIKDKAAAIAQAIINTAVAVTAGMASPAVPPFPSAIAAGIVGAIQVGLIAAKPIPEFEKGGVWSRGGVPKGPSHARGGISLIDSLSGNKVGEMEGGEPYMILSQNTYANNKDTIDRLLYNSMHRNGAPIFKAGGVLATAPQSIPRQALGSSSSNAGQQAMTDLGVLVSSVEGLRMDMNEKFTSIKAYITYNQIEDSITEMEKIRQQAGRS